MSKNLTINLLIEVLMFAVMTMNLITHNTDALLYTGFMFIWLTLRHIDIERSR